MKYGILISLMILAGCTTVDVRSIAAAAKVDKICIQFNDDVNVDDFVPVMQEDFFNHGITSVVLKAENLRIYFELCGRPLVGLCALHG